MPQILIVDDNPGDIALMRQAIGEVGLQVDVQAAENAVQAFIFLRHKSGKSLPDVILLDHRMPVFDGVQMLTILRESPNLREIPVIVFTSSTREVDRIASMRAGAKCVKTKPPTWQEYVELARSLAAYLESGTQAKPSLS